ncbi:MAG TPA: hypothetical protein VFY92_11435 [Hyphomicrobiaceae bacterium]|nr:hypothetical protein [Hyphomicrobiaceae bacterium]
MSSVRLALVQVPLTATAAMLCLCAATQLSARIGGVPETSTTADDELISR